MIDDIREVVLQTGKILLKYFNNLEEKDITVKTGGGVQTVADVQAEEFLIDALKKIKPQSGILAEESGVQKASSGRWIIDPLDGTSNFVTGLPCFAVSVGYEKEAESGDIELGVVYQPILNEMFYAVKGQGAFLNDQPIQVSTKAELQQSMMATGFFYHKGVNLHQAVCIFEKVQENVLGVRRFGAASIDLAYLAAGRYDGFWERGLAPWDLAAGTLLIREAGGKLTDYSGNPFSLYGEETAASNGRIHDKLVTTIDPKLEHCK